MYKGSSSGNRHALHGLGRGHQLRPLQISPGDHGPLVLGALQDNAVLRFPGGNFDGLVEQGLVGDDSVAFDPTRSRNNEFGPGIVDARRQFVGRKTAEDHRMDRANPRTSEHGNDRLWHHGHVEDHPVTLLNSLVHQCAGKTGGQVTQFAVRETLDHTSHRTVINQGNLFSAAVGDVEIERIVATVQIAAGKPAIEGLA